MLVLSPWLSRLYALPVALLLAIGVANVVYGTFSLSLARRTTRPRALLALLVIANTTWAVLCGLATFVVAPWVTGFGLAQLLGEGLFVGGLTALEWRHPALLLAAS